MKSSATHGPKVQKPLSIVSDSIYLVACVMWLPCVPLHSPIVAALGKSFIFLMRPCVSYSMLETHTHTFNQNHAESVDVFIGLEPGVIVRQLNPI